MRKITILTDPIPHGDLFLKEYLRIFLRFFRDIFFKPKQNYNKSKFRGHFAVTRSLVTGLSTLNINFNYNPRNIKELAEDVIVLAGVKTLNQCIKLKEQGLIRNLYAGPNIVIFSSDHNYILSNQLINKVITPCKWVSNMYINECPSLAHKCIEWPAGVDINYWSPNSDFNKDQVLFFDKRVKSSDINLDSYIDLVKDLGYKVKVLVYGEYKHEDYFNELNKSMLMVCFSNGSESQGIAWNEAWSMNVPTLILESKSNVYNGKYYECSSAPYLNNENGLFFKDFDSFKIILMGWKNNTIQFNPRKWTTFNATDEIAANNLLNLVTT